MGCVFHLNLEGIAFKTNLVKFDSGQYPTFVTFESSSSVMNFEPSDKPYVFRGEIAHKHSAYRPVYNIYTTYIARAYGEVISLIVTSRI